MSRLPTTGALSPILAVANNTYDHITAKIARPPTINAAAPANPAAATYAAGASNVNRISNGNLILLLMFPLLREQGY